ncbi:uncharacterized protein C16orf86 homolog [Pelodiscus sinensis]|uniref:uncharacterized protein C16orf86 homolog n=1 Tax=Pelodiscus sinensis TaxID=13735 RepID=UPI003F6B8D61
MASTGRSPSEKRPGGKAVPSRFLPQLAAALDNPTIKALEWDEDGQGVRVDARLYGEEAEVHRELFPELRAPRSVSGLQAWLLASGFKVKATKADPSVLVFQHASFRKLLPKAGQAEAPLAPRQHKKAKKRKSSVELAAAAGGAAVALPPDAPGTDRRPPRLRPLYQYINYDNPELNSPAEEESDAPGEAAGARDDADTEAAAGSRPTGAKDRKPESCTPRTPPRAEVDKSTQVDIDKMLSVCAAHLVPPLSPQYK